MAESINISATESSSSQTSGQDLPKEESVEEDAEMWAREGSVTSVTLSIMMPYSKEESRAKQEEGINNGFCHNSLT